MHSFGTASTVRVKYVASERSYRIESADEKPQPWLRDENTAVMTRDAPILSAFDFDGTLTCKDSFVSFLLDSCGLPGLGAKLLTRPGLVADYIRTGNRGALKSRLLFALFGAISRADLDALIAAFAARTGMTLFRPDALRAWRATSGLRVIVTASPECLVARFGEMIGADRVIGTRLGFSADGRLLPDLDGANCRGEEKMRRLREVYGDDLDLVAAYGDTAGDREMIAAARDGHYRVFHERP